MVLPSRDYQTGSAYGSSIGSYSYGVVDEMDDSDHGKNDVDDFTISRENI